MNCQRTSALIARPFYDPGPARRSPGRYRRAGPQYGSIAGRAPPPWMPGKDQAGGWRRSADRCRRRRPWSGRLPKGNIPGQHHKRARRSKCRAVLPQAAPLHGQDNNTPLMEGRIYGLAIGDGCGSRVGVLGLLMAGLLVQCRHVPNHVAVDTRQGQYVTGRSTVGRWGQENAIAPDDWRRPAFSGDARFPDDVLRQAPMRRQHFFLRDSLPCGAPEPRPFFAAYHQAVAFKTAFQGRPAFDASPIFACFHHFSFISIFPSNDNLVRWRNVVVVRNNGYDGTRNRSRGGGPSQTAPRSQREEVGASSIVAVACSGQPFPQKKQPGRNLHRSIIRLYREEGIRDSPRQRATGALSSFCPARLVCSGTSVQSVDRPAGFRSVSKRLPSLGSALRGADTGRLSPSCDILSSVRRHT